MDSESGSDRLTGTQYFIYKLNYTIKSFAVLTTILSIWRLNIFTALGAWTAFSFISDLGFLILDRNRNGFSAAWTLSNS